MTIANYLTLIRLLISPVFLFLILEFENLGISYTVLPYILLCLMTFSEVSDAMDGYLARKYNQITELGKILDPMADSMSKIAYFLAFTQAPIHLPIALVFVILYRDSVISTLRTICALKGFALAARPSGKLKAIIQAIAAYVVVVLMIPHSHGELSTEMFHSICTWVVMGAAVYTVFSGADYIIANRMYIQRLLATKSAG